jgi:hypothetical protein
MKEMKPLNITALAPPAGRPWASSLGGGIFKRTVGNFQPDLTNAQGTMQQAEVVVRGVQGQGCLVIF